MIIFNWFDAVTFVAVVFSIVFVIAFVFAFVTIVTRYIFRVNKAIETLVFIADSTGETLDEIRIIRLYLDRIEQSNGHAQATSQDYPGDVA